MKILVTSTELRFTFITLVLLFFLFSLSSKSHGQNPIEADEKIKEIEKTIRDQFLGTDINRVRTQLTVSF